MGRNIERDIKERNLRLQKILDTAFPIFAKKGIETVSMNEIADACDIGIATLYRHYRSKSDLVLAISVGIWDDFVSEYHARYAASSLSAAKEFDYYLDSYLELYRNHKDILRFNQYFNVYIKKEKTTSEQMETFTKVIEMTANRFHGVYVKGLEDRTIRTDVSEEEMFSTSMHLMLAAVTRYAVGLVYQNSSEPEKELVLLKNMLLKEYLV